MVDCSDIDRKSEKKENEKFIFDKFVEFLIFK